MIRRYLWIGVLGLIVASVLLGGIQKAFTQPPKPKACIIDIDGTIANENERRAMATNPDGSTNWRKYFDPELVKKDKPILKSREVLRWLEQKGIKIFYVSSRETAVLEATKWWLRQHNFPPGEVYHRKPFARSMEYKIDTVRAIQKRYDVIFGVGDRDRDITAYQTCGITAIKVVESSEEDWIRVKSEITKLLK
jgi:predicted secreted acid phosphatase